MENYSTNQEWRRERVLIKIAHQLQPKKGLRFMIIKDLFTTQSELRNDYTYIVA